MIDSKIRFLLFYIILFLHFPIYANPNKINLEQNNSIESPAIIVNSSRTLEFDSLNSFHNDLFKDYSKIVEENYKLSAAGKECEILFFKYKVKPNENLFTIASRCCINYDTIATLNNISSVNENLTNKTILLPTIQGLFINLNNTNKSVLNTILFEKYTNEIFTKKGNAYIIDNERFIFFSNERFDGTSRYYFLEPGLSLPLPKDSFWISSEFGKRKNPFTGNLKNHNGIDLAAKEGTEVFAIKDGKVALNISNDFTFGNYIIISHDDGSMTSVYAHLNKSLVKENDYVKKGELIGYVGSTGQVTGPHLHFEIRQNGAATNPKSVLKLDN